MKKTLFAFTSFKSLFISSLLVVFGSYSSTAAASLSVKPAKPSQSVATKAERLSKSSTASITNRPNPSAKSNRSASKRINSVFSQWNGTRYQMGGSSKAGIDCSAFVREVMDKAFNKNMPRSTAEQRHIGRVIAKTELRPGDLVFFRKNNHVGVYIGNGKFVHASTSQGVTTSSLSDSYWAKTYTQSRRVM